MPPSVATMNELKAALSPGVFHNTSPVEGFGRDDRGLRAAGIDDQFAVDDQWRRCGTPMIVGVLAAECSEQFLLPDEFAIGRD